MAFQRIVKVSVDPPAQGGIRLWTVTFEGEVVTASGESATPLTIVTSDGEAVRALAASVERMRAKR